MDLGLEIGTVKLLIRAAMLGRGLSCYPCLKHGIRNLIRFYDERPTQRHQFEIFSLYIDVEDELKSVTDLDKKLESIVKHVWGKPQPFPVLLDPSFTTMERYGLPGFGTLILVDPQGNLVKGDETVLAEKLKE